MKTPFSLETKNRLIHAIERLSLPKRNDRPVDSLSKRAATPFDDGMLSAHYRCLKVSIPILLNMSDGIISINPTSLSLKLAEFVRRYALPDWCVVVLNLHLP